MILLVTMNKDEQFIHSFGNFVLSELEEEIMKILEGTDERIHHSILIKFPELIVADSELSHGILCNPNHYIMLCDKGLVYAQKSMFDKQEEELKCELLIKTNVHTQFTELPECPELYRSSFPFNEDLGLFLRVTGTVVRVTSPKVLEFQRDYMCSKCKYIFTIKADYELFYIIPNPYKCKNPDGCNGTKITPIKAITHYNCKDYQEIKIQEQVCNLDIGCMPRTMWVTLEDNIVDTCKPGDDVSVCGIVMRRWRPLYNGSRCDIEIVMKGNFIEFSNNRRAAVIVTQEIHKDFSDYWKKHANNPLRGRNLILASFCPQVYGLHIVKLALSLVLAGGVHKVDSSGNRIRGSSHLLLVGEPATGKSHLMRFAAKLSPQSVVTSGVGTTSAGLTASAVKENGVWQLEAGALVLSDGGICCIDEFDCIKEHDRTSIHEAMEQQTISVAKAGIVCKLNTRCSIIATTNVSKNYDPEDANSNVTLSSPLLSRFDLVLTLLDSQNPEWDLMLSTFIIEERDPLIEFKNIMKDDGLWELDKLRAYFSVIKRIKPVLTSEAGTILTRYYQAQRNATVRNVARTTVRLLESLVRLSQAHARLMFRDHVTVQDTIIAIVLMEYSMNSSLLGVTSTLHASFSEDPTMEYRNQVQIILRKLELEDILEKELVNFETNFEASEINRESNRPASYLIQEDGEAHKITLPTSKPLTVPEHLTQVLTGIKKAKEREETSKRKTRSEDVECEVNSCNKIPKIQNTVSEEDIDLDELLELEGTNTVENPTNNVNINHDDIETDLVVHLHTKNDNLNRAIPTISKPETNKNMNNIKVKFPDSRTSTTKELHTIGKQHTEIHNISTCEKSDEIRINKPCNTNLSIACADTTKKCGKILSKCNTTTNSQVGPKKNLASLIKFGKKLTNSQVTNNKSSHSLDSVDFDSGNKIKSKNNEQARISLINSSQPEMKKFLNLYHEAFDDNDMDI